MQTYEFSRLRTRIVPEFENRQNISGAAGSAEAIRTRLTGDRPR